MNLFDVIWKTYSVAGRLPFAHEVRAPFDTNPVAAAEGRGSSPGGATVKLVIALSRNAATAAIGLSRAARDGVVRWHKRRTSIRELMALDDRLLADIGLRRSEIGTVVDAMLKETSSPRPRRTRPVETLPANENIQAVAANDNEPKVAA